MIPYLSSFSSAASPTRLPPPPEPQIHRSGFPKLIDPPLGLGTLIALPLPERALLGLIQGSLPGLAEMPLLAGSPLALPGGQVAFLHTPVPVGPQGLLCFQKPVGARRDREGTFCTP